MRESIERALRNIAAYGDTDIFPFPFERHVFHDMEPQAVDVILSMHDNFHPTMAGNPPSNIETLSPVGYTGFRWATQIEPFWNAYYLSLVLELAERIEAVRSPVSARNVFSYRYEWDATNNKIFSNSNWRDYRNRTKELCGDFEYVVITDIADFYPRIYHHRLENALARLPGADALSKRIMKFLQVCSSNDSYGLPVGGPASRLLAELALADTDRHLDSKKIAFCRYADDYTIFASSKEDAYRNLVFLADKLFNEGLALQKKKTRILTREEYLESVGGLDPTDSSESTQTDEDRLLSISVRFDPYSPTAVDDYENLKSALQEIDIVGVLGREVAKASIDQAVARQAISAVSVLDPNKQEGAIRTLLDPENIQVLSPVIVSVLRLVRGIYKGLPELAKSYADEFLVGLYRNNSFLLSLELHQAFYVQALAQGHSQEKEQILVDMYDRSASSLVRRQIIFAMIDLEALYWLRDAKQQYGASTEWEKRAFLVCSYWLGDEGSHWLNHLKAGLNPSQKLVRDWFHERWKENNTVPH